MKMACISDIECVEKVSEEMPYCCALSMFVLLPCHGGICEHVRTRELCVTELQCTTRAVNPSFLL
jgi:hypothetical protein